MHSNSAISSRLDDSPIPYRDHKLLTNRQMELMAGARTKGTFAPEALRDIIYRGSEPPISNHEGSGKALVLTSHHSRHKLIKKFAAELHQQLGENDDGKLPASYGEIDRTEMYRRGLRWGRLMFELQMKDESEYVFAFDTYRHAIFNCSPFGLHFGMFVPTIRLQGSPEQQAYWLPLCERGKIIGTYAQTELGHGTFIRGLETTATFDPKTDEFLIHSPTITSTKFWPGSSASLSPARMLIFPVRWSRIYLYPCHRHGPASGWYPRPWHPSIHCTTPLTRKPYSPSGDRSRGYWSQAGLQRDRQWLLFFPPCPDSALAHAERPFEARPRRYLPPCSPE
jgi:hypothetical protein